MAEAVVSVSRGNDTLYITQLPRNCRTTVAFDAAADANALAIDISCGALTLYLKEAARNSGPFSAEVLRGKIISGFIGFLITACGAVALSIWFARKERAAAGVDLLKEPTQLLPARPSPSQSTAQISFELIPSQPVPDQGPPETISFELSAPPKSPLPAEDPTNIIDFEFFPDQGKADNEQSEDPFMHPVVSQRVEYDEQQDLLEPEGPAELQNHRRATRIYDVPPPLERRTLRPITASVIAAIVSIGVVVFAHPAVGQLAAPNRTVEGATIDVPYSTSGLGVVAYSVSQVDGAHIADGKLSQREGTIRITAPVVHRQQTYRVIVTMSGPLGSASRDATIRADALPEARIITRSLHPPWVASFALGRARTGDDDTISAYYDVKAQKGSVRLVDSEGIQYGLFPIDKTGETAFHIPASVGSRPLSVELRIVSDGIVGISKVAVPTQENVSRPAAKPAPNNLDVNGDAPAIAVAASVQSGGPIRVRVLHHYPELRVALRDAKARPLQSISVGTGKSFVELRHPSVRVTTRFTIEATYRVHDEDDTILLPITVLPNIGG